MANERVEYILNDTQVNSDAESKQGRQVFTPGIATPANASNPARTLDQNWPQDFIVKTGIPAVDEAGGQEYIRVIYTGRNTVSDETIPAPIVTDTKTFTQTTSGGTSTYVVDETVTQNNNGVQERNSGYNRVKITEAPEPPVME